MTKTNKTGTSTSISTLIKQAIRCKCPHCHQGRLFKSGLTVEVVNKCDVCGTELAHHDSADGPAVFLIFILGFLLVPLALIFEVAFAPPLYIHVILWGLAIFALTALSLRPLKSVVIALQYKYRQL